MKESDTSLYSHVKCQVELRKKAEAIKVLDNFSKEDEEFAGEVDLADLYLEAGYYNWRSSDLKKDGAVTINILKFLTEQKIDWNEFLLF
ncbi:hypothetical protein ACSFXN_07185 [Planococcus sp. 1R117A]|uniref:hypothetical protein n=1 Tax=Planococcus sp. 1R117A TaxID=3447020 RepID=UPI003EDBFB24